MVKQGLLTNHASACTPVGCKGSSGSVRGVWVSKSSSELCDAEGWTRQLSSKLAMREPCKEPPLFGDSQCPEMSQMAGNGGEAVLPSLVPG